MATAKQALAQRTTANQARQSVEDNQHLLVQPHMYEMDHVTSLLQTETLKEDFYLFGDVFTGLQKWGL